MKLTLSVFVLLAFVFTSCQKEISTEITSGAGGGGGGGIPTTDLLVKTVQKNGQDSLVTLYTYNGNKKIIDFKQTGIDEQGDAVDNEYRYYRNSLGIITNYTAINADLVSLGIDSVPVIVHYNTSSSRYTSYVLNFNSFGVIILDSSAFVYDGTGKIIEEDVYESPSGDGSDYYLSGKINYTYDANSNISQLNIHDLDNSGTETFAATTKIISDSKKSPFYFGIEGFAVGHPEWASPNNISGEQLSDSNGPSDDQTVSIVYTYNPKDKPTTGQSTVIPDNLILNTSYYYQ